MALVKNLRHSYQIEDALTSLDGRNRHKLLALAPYFSEVALNKERIFVEIEYLKSLSIRKVIRPLKKSELSFLKNIIDSFSGDGYQTLREIEATTNHDVQAVIVYIRQLFEESSLRDLSPMVHFGLTSEDINNLAYARLIQKSMHDVFLPELNTIFDVLKKSSHQYKDVDMLGKTHGQAALPTTFGKELAVYASRLSKELVSLSSVILHGKLNGNVGNFNAHTLVFPKVDWLGFSKSFISSLGLVPDMLTTQIEPYDSFIQLFHHFSRINNILNGLCKDIWMYAMVGYCKQRIVANEDGSTALPHKVNPIYFEGSEGGFGIANALFSFYAEKLSYSRLQRDLSDATVRRSFAIAFGYSLLSYQSIIIGLDRIAPDEDRMEEDLNNHYEILSEAVQSELKVLGIRDAYQKAKGFFRGKKVTKKSYEDFIDGLTIPKNIKFKLINLTPHSYGGVASKLVSHEI